MSFFDKGHICTIDIIGDKCNIFLVFQLTKGPIPSVDDL